VPADTDTADPDLGRLYRDARERLTSLVSSLDAATLGTAVPACPGWSVRDVVAHLTAVAEDVLAGTMTGPPSEELAAAQVARFEGCELAEVLTGWEKLAPRFEEFIGERRSWHAVLDVASHEQDVRAAVGQPGARDTDAVRLGAGWLLARLRPPVPTRVVVEDGEFRVGPDGGAELRLATSRWEAFRWRLGRRSRAQLAALDWSGDPAPVLDHLVIFGPASGDVIE